MTRTPEEVARIKVRAQARGRFEVTNKAEGVDMMLYDEIGPYGVTAADFMKAMASAKGKPLNLYINSPGGDVFDGLAMLNQLRRHDQPVHVFIDGLAASAASFVAMAGETVTIGRNAQVMVHDAAGLCFGNSADMTDLASRLDQISDNIASIYAGRTDKTADEWRDIMRAETWFTADEAVAAGLADEVSGDGEDPEVSNRFDLSIFAHAGRSQARNALPAADGLSTTQPPAPEPEATTQEGDAMSDLRTALAQRLGMNVPDSELDDDKLLEAFDEALSEQTTEPKPEPAPLPEGTVVVDAAQLDALRADAEAGRQAKEQLDAQRRAGIIDSAIAAGKIAPAKRADWLNRLNESEDVITNVISDLEPVFNVAAKGYTGDDKDHGDNAERSIAAKAGWEN